MKINVFKRLTAIVLCSVLLLSILTAVPMTAEAANKYMEGESADFSIVLDDSGGATVVETWDCYFGGDMISRYRRNYDIPDPAYCDIEVLEVSMDEEPMTLLDAPDENRPDGCAAVFQDGNTVSVEMYMRSENEYRSFQITYYLSNAVILYSDVAEFHLNLTSTKESFDIDTLTAYIEIPYGTRDRGLYFWGHGPVENASFDARVEDGMVNQFDLYTEQVTRDRSVTVRFAMPLELFPFGTRTVDEPALDRILAEEGTAPAGDPSGGAEVPTEDPDPYVEPDYPEYKIPWYERLFDSITGFFSFLGSLFFGIWGILSLALCVLPLASILLFSSLMQKYAEKKYLPKMYAKNRHKPVEAPQYYRQLPDKMKPAVVYKLMSIYPIPGEGKEIRKKGNAFSATILDLVESGLIRMETNPMGDAVYQVTPEAENAPLTEYEKNIITLFSEAGASENPMTTKQITTYMRDNYYWCKQMYSAFDTAVDQAFDAAEMVLTFPCPERDQKWKVKVAILNGLFIFVGMQHLIGFFAGLALGVLFAFVNTAAINAIMDEIHPGFQLLTQEGENRYALWKAYANFLQDFTTFEEKETQDVKIWRKYLVYATALGCSEKVIENLKMSLPEVYKSFGSDPWLYHYDEIYESANAIDTEGGYTIRSSSSSGGFSSGGDDDGGWGGMSDSGGDTDSGSSGSDFD